ncbi:membrane protein [Gordonia phage Madeline]|uniref:Membrane protein n=1 Tax=Gordonia phage Madeline TaxID=2591189 RepID=A0A514A309_9CAUD|nr:membrane protein [Gordonia phage Madeline]QDH47651.1 membrane protein [Gordonia phage Madeline]
MNTVLDVILVRTSPIPNSFLIAIFFWGCVVITAASYVPRVARWLTDRDLEQIDDDELADDHLRIVRGEIR